jgi:hypothetical protein
MKKDVLALIQKMILADDETFDLKISQRENEVSVFLRSGDSFSVSAEWRAESWAVLLELMKENPEGL